MDREKWTKAGLEIADRLREIEKIAKRNGMSLTSLAAGNELSWATYIQDDTQWSVTLYPDGRVELEEDQEPYYKRV